MGGNLAPARGATTYLCIKSRLTEHYRADVSRPKLGTRTDHKRLVMEQACPGERHEHAVIIASSDDLLVAQ